MERRSAHVSGRCLLVAHSLLSTRDHMHSKAGAVFSLLICRLARSEAAGDMNRLRAPWPSSRSTSSGTSTARSTCPHCWLCCPGTSRNSCRLQVDAARAKLVAWAPKACMLTSVEPARSAECVAETYEAVLKPCRLQHACLAGIRGLWQGGDGLAAGGATQFSLEEVEEPAPQS